jgi:ribosomal protein S18 acetylase RimI-like enzyme
MRALEKAAGDSRVFASAWSEDTRAKESYTRAGFRVVRHTFRMGIDLDRELDEPVWPEGIRMRTFEPGDERAVYEAHQETFEDLWEDVRRPYEEWAHWFLSSHMHHPELWFLALDGEQLAGIELCMPDQTSKGLGWVAILGVRRPWRGRGLGRALLLHAFHEFRHRGFERVVLGVDAESPTGANKLYERAGMRVLHRYETYAMDPVA